MIDGLSGVGFSNPRFNLLQMPALRLEICLNRFTQEISAIPFHRVCQGIEGRYFVEFKPETDGLFFHNTK